MAGFEPVIRPGGSGTIVASAKVAGGGSQWVKTVVVGTNDPEAPRLHLRFRFRGRSAIDVRPSGEVSVSVGSGEAAAATLTVRRTDGRELVVRPEWEGDPPFRVEAGREGPSSWRVTVRLDASSSAVGGAAVLRLHTNHPATPLVRIPVRFRVRS